MNSQQDREHQHKSEEGDFIYKGHRVPVIDPERSSREDLLRYVRILEDRLDLQRVFVMRDEDQLADTNDVGEPLEHDIPDDREASDIREMMGLVASSLPQVERVRMLVSGLDRVGCLEIGEQLLRSKDFTPEQPPKDAPKSV